MFLTLIKSPVSYMWKVAIRQEKPLRRLLIGDGGLCPDNNWSKWSDSHYILKGEPV